jgi:DNA repair exonuclease SbcCD ATPase subunit
MISDLDKYRRAADEKQSEIRATVRNQESIRIRLDQEITPNIEKLEKELKKLQNVESALSPNTGLPHVYMVRFINSVIEIANTYIRLVWNYDMEIMPLKESNKLDFNFPVRLNKNSKVKDISICSKGQKEIVDLCWTLGLYLQMGLGDFLPLKLDEPDGALSEAHRTKLLTLLSNLLRQGNIKQLFLINHNASLFTSFAHSQIVCLNPDGIVVPHKYNESVIIK